MSRSRIPIPEAEITDFCHRNQVKSLELFGSVLRADFRPDSDVDVLVEFEAGARIGFVALGRMQRELTALLERPVDLVPKDGLKPVIRQDVLAGAEVIYENCLGNRSSTHALCVKMAADIPTDAYVSNCQADHHPFR